MNNRNRGKKWNWPQRHRKYFKQNPTEENFLNIKKEVPIKEASRIPNRQDQKKFLTTHNIQNIYHTEQKNIKSFKRKRLRNKDKPIRII